MAANEKKNPDTTSTESQTSEIQSTDEKTTIEEARSEETSGEAVSTSENNSDTTTDSKPVSETDEYSSNKNETIARRAFENYGKYMYPYGIKYHWYTGSIREYEGNGVWYFEVEVTITNDSGAEKKSIAEGRVDFTKESVIEFNIK